MISFIKGKIYYTDENTVIIQCENIGYEIYTTNKIVQKLQENKDAMIHTFMNVKEDGISLYGFLKKSEKDMFKKLITISGVGPKSAISLLDVMAEDEIAKAIISSDIKALSRGQGIGKKTAERIILELKDKLGLKDAISFDENTLEKDGAGDITDALLALGFSNIEVANVIHKIDYKNMMIDEAISQALKILSI